MSKGETRVIAEYYLFSQTGIADKIKKNLTSWASVKEDEDKGTYTHYPWHGGFIEVSAVEEENGHTHLKIRRTRPLPHKINHMFTTYGLEKICSREELERAMFDRECFI